MPNEELTILPTPTLAMKQGLEQAYAIAQRAQDSGVRGREAMMASLGAAMRGAEDLGGRMLAYSQAAMADQLGAAASFAKAKNAEELLTLQAKFARAALETYAEEFANMADLVSNCWLDAFPGLCQPKSITE